MGLIVDSHSEINGFDMEDANLFSKFIITDADENQLKQ